MSMPEKKEMDWPEAFCWFARTLWFHDPAPPKRLTT